VRVSSKEGRKSFSDNKEHYFGQSAYHNKNNHSLAMNSTPISGIDPYISPTKQKIKQNTDEKTPTSGIIVLKSTPYK